MIPPKLAWLGHRARLSRLAHRRVSVVLAVVSATFVALSCILFVWPAAGRLRHADAVLMLDGPDERSREQSALALVREGYAPYLLFSEGHYPSVPCPREPAVVVVCFVPKPARTVGEIEFAARYAARHHWREILVVSGHSQATRARLLLRRCFPGRAIVVPAPAPPLGYLLVQVAYEWGALVKALVVDPGC